MSEHLPAVVRPAQPPALGWPSRQDYEYERRGTANRFHTGEFLMGRRWVSAADRRTAIDRAQKIQHLIDVGYPDAERSVLVMDNFNTPARRGPALG